jgi:threonine synthase
VIASNDNDILPRTVASGVYEKRGVVATTSPSMDIEVSSNFERWLFEAGGRDGGAIRRQMASLQQAGRFEVSGGAAALAQDFDAAPASEADVAATIRRTLGGAGYLADPHSACGILAAERTARPDGVPQVVLATAHPAKFPDTMTAVTGARPGLPPRLCALMTDPERITVLPNEIARVESYIADIARAVR